MPASSTAAEDLRPEIVVCVCDAALSASIGDASVLSGGLKLARARRVDGDDVESVAREVESRLRDPACKALLIVGAAGAQAFRIQTRAENRVLNGKARLLPTGPGVVRATASAQELLRALADAGHAAEVSSDADADAASYVLFRAMSGLPDGRDAPSVALLRVPTGDPRRAETGCRVAMAAMARHLSPLPRGLTH